MKKRNIIKQILNLKAGEAKIVLLPFLYSFFAGASLSFFVTSSTSLFLTSFKRDMLPVVFIASGVIVWLIGQIYSYVQKRKSFGMTVKIGLAFLLLSILFFLAVYIANSSLIIIFILYAWIRVFAYLHAVSFWGILGRLFSLQQAKRLFGLITGGEVLASILSFFSIPFLLKIMSTEDLLLISGFALFIGFLLIILIVKKHKSALQGIKKKKTVESTEKKEISFLQNKYYKLFFLIAFIPIFAQFFVDFIFQAQVKVEFPDKESLTAFVGIFFGVSAIIEFVLKTVVSGRLMSKYGIKLGLLAFPLVLAFSFTLVSLVGLIYGTVTLFFSMVALGRLFTRAVRTSFNDPATQILYQAMPPDERIAFQNKVESGPKAYASIFAGILLLIFVKIPDVNLVFFSVFLLAVIFVWIKAAVSIYSEYKIMLQNVLKEKGSGEIKSKTDIIFEILKNHILNAVSKSQFSIAKLARIIFPFKTYELIEQHKLQLFEDSTEEYKFKELTNFSKSENPAQRRIAALKLTNYPIYKVERLLKKLLSDSHFRVRTEAIITSGKMKDKELFQFLLNNFNIEEYNETASSAMVNIGEQILPDLSQVFRTAEFNANLQIKCIGIFEEIGGETAIKFLKSNLNYPNQLISERIISALGKLNYKPTKTEILLFSNKLEEEIDNYVYIISCFYDLEKFNATSYIYKALNSEKKDKKNKIFSLLSVLYDSSAISLIRKNIESENVNSKGFALEIADMAIDEKHKTILLPIFNNLPNAELLNAYRFLFSYEALSVEKRLIDIVNSAYSKTTNYTKAAALHYLADFKSSETLTLLKANIVNPNEIIREKSALNLLNYEESLFDNLIAINLPRNSFLKELPKKLKTINNENALIFNKLNLLKQFDIFSSISYKKIDNLAKYSDELKLEVGDTVKINVKNAATFYVLLSGILVDNETEKNVTQGEILCIYNTKDNLRELKYTANSSCSLLKSKIYLLNNLLVENQVFMRKYTDNIWA